METQSAALAYAFGLNYEYGKRKIKSMSNEEFNSLTPENIAELSEAHTWVQIDAFKRVLPNMTQFQELIFIKHAEIEKAKILQNVQLAKWAIANGVEIAISGTTQDTTNIGTKSRRDTTTTQETTSTPSEEQQLKDAIDAQQNLIDSNYYQNNKELWDSIFQETFQTLTYNQRSEIIDQYIANTVVPFIGKLRLQYKEKYGKWY